MEQVKKIDLTDNMRILERWIAEWVKMLEEIGYLEEDVGKLESSIWDMNEMKADLEEKTYRLSCENYERQSTKEGLIDSIDEVYKALHGHSNKLRDCLNQILEDDIKESLMGILKSSKVIK